VFGRRNGVGHAASSFVKNSTALNKQLFLRADKAVPYGVVMEVMSCIRAVGIINLGMVAESGGGPVSGDAEKVQPDIKPATGMTSQ